MKVTLKLLLAIIGVFVVSLALFYAVYGAFIIFNKGQVITFNFEKSSDLASWIQAVGSIGAILGAFVIGERQAAKARENALDVYQAERRRIDAGARGVVNQLFVELVSLEMSATRLDYDNFCALWQSMLKGTSQASVDAFDHLPLHELGTASRVRIGFEMRGTLVHCTSEISNTLDGRFDPQTDGPTDAKSGIELNNRRQGHIRTSLKLALERQKKLRDDFYTTYTTN
ncbi:hypothetical protein [Achromobacter ruhlandii]|uniref:Uncharacterized protein n=1 Tax=Achromobacter ruhlandii TaxID=72557 RepID=A0A2M9GT59_9BURK|nr:hypothetical protein [Achromobacter ruhlandii]PJM67685.1 hypothetical protein CV751_23715 [Achromobacter ruhlandii]CAB3904579.1 hypothetical protein LMG3328_04473 [Achromobacter ruhlandii]